MNQLSFLDLFNIAKDLISIALQLILIILQLVSVIYVVKALRFTAQQIQHSERTHAETLEWERKLATDHILENKPDRKITGLLNGTFNTLEWNKPIENVISTAQEDKNIMLGIHHVLNWYERLARGMKNDVYDEEIIKTALRHTFIKVYTNYSLYIRHRRENVNPNAWKLFEEYATKWAGK